MTAQTFGLTISTGNVEGQAVRYQMTAAGVFAPVAVDPLEALTDAELEALAAVYEAQQAALQAGAK